MNDNKTKKLTTIGMLCAIAYLLMLFFRIPVVLFLKYEPKDVVITIGGFLMGPMTAFIISSVVALIEMITTSDTGIIGCIMNAISSCAFACTASFIYKHKKNIKGAVVGLIVGTIFMVVIMLLWNYLITPLYMKVPREQIIPLLIPAFLPFNLLKGSLNSAITFLVYKPVVSSLRKADLLPKTDSLTAKKSYTGAMLICALVIITCIFFVLTMRGII